MPCYSIDGVTPVVHPDAYVHPTAVLIGDVYVASGCYIGPLASLRGDFGCIRVEQGANVQDSCVLHSFPLRELVVESDGHIGHGAVLHGCVVRHGALIGMNAVVMDGAEIGEFSFVAACAFVRSGLIVPKRSMVAGLPAKVMRDLTDEEIAWKLTGTQTYQQLAARCLGTMSGPITPLREPEAVRPKLQVRAVKPLVEHRGG